MKNDTAELQNVTQQTGCWHYLQPAASIDLLPTTKSSTRKKTGLHSQFFLDASAIYQDQSAAVHQ